MKRRSGSVRKKILSPVKQFPRAMVSFFKKFMILIRQAFKMMVGLEKENLGEGGLPEENVVQALIEKTRIWLVKQMGKRFPSGTGGNLLKHWKWWSLCFKVSLTGARGRLCLLLGPRVLVRVLLLLLPNLPQFKMSARADWNRLVVDLNNIFKFIFPFAFDCSKPAADEDSPAVSDSSSSCWSRISFSLK